MNLRGVNVKTVALYGGLAVGGYLFLTKILPGLLEGIGHGAGDAAAGAAKGLAEGAGKTGASLMLAAPRAIDSALKELGLPDQSLEKMGSALGQGIYAVTHVFSPAPGGEDRDYIIRFPDGSRHAIPATVVDSRGRFKYNGLMYQIKDDATGVHYATRL